MNKISKFVYSIFMLNPAFVFNIYDGYDCVIFICDVNGRIKISKHHPFDTKISGDLSNIVFYL